MDYKTSWSPFYVTIRSLANLTQGIAVNGIMVSAMMPPKVIISLPNMSMPCMEDAKYDNLQAI